MNKKPKIAIIGAKGFPSFGGGARSTESLINELYKDYDITVLSINSHTTLNTGEYNGVMQIVLKGSRFKRMNTLIYYIKSLFYVLFKEDFDLIHVQHIYAGLIIPILRIKYKVVNTVRGIIPQNDNKWSFIDKKMFRFFEYLSLTFSNEIVSVCDPHINYLKQIKNKKIHYIPNGVYINNEILEHKSTDDYITFSAGRIISLKGLHILLDALKEISYKGKLVVIGSLDHVPEYKELILKKSQNLNIDFLGLIKDKNQLFEIIANSKLFIFPSLNEGMSNMLLETASLKTPILASDIEENKAIFNEQEVTYFKSNNVLDLSQKLTYCLGNQTELSQKAEKAFLKVCNQHDWKDIAKKYDTIYNSLLR